MMNTPLPEANTMTCDAPAGRVSVPDSPELMPEPSCEDPEPFDEFTGSFPASPPLTEPSKPS